jgi:phosphatidylglycerol---prolipoprotein diacylglyceryl transferase
VIPVIAFPAIDPVLVEIGPLAVRWYALAYVAGLVLGWWYVARLVRRDGAGWTTKEVDDFLVWATGGVILGGRIGYVLFYNLPVYAEDPLAVLKVWEGGMSFHGGLLGVTVAIALFGLKRKKSVLALADRIACAAPIGLFFGRLANFVNGELYGRPSDVAWAMVFPHGGPLPRHPSQIYEAALEGFVLFAVMLVLWSRPGLRARQGLLTGAFLMGYAIARAAVELVREPDGQLGFILGPLTMGQLLCVPLFAAGLWLVLRTRRPEQRERA